VDLSIVLVVNVYQRVLLVLPSITAEKARFVKMLIAARPCEATGIESRKEMSSWLAVR
jgi:hypothetical protein